MAKKNEGRNGRGGAGRITIGALVSVEEKAMVADISTWMGISEGDLVRQAVFAFARQQQAERRRVT